MSKKKKQTKNYLFEEVIDFLKHNSSKSYNYKQIASAIDLQPESDRFKIIEVLAALEKQNLIVETERGKYSMKSAKRALEGTIDFNSHGDAYVSVIDEENDVFIHNSKTKDALQGDLVRIVLREGSGRKKEGEVTEVIHRNKTEFVGIIQMTPKTTFLIPDNYKVHVDFYIPHDKKMGVENGQKVLARFIEWPSDAKNPSAEVIKIFGFPGEHNTEIHAIMAEYGLPMDFPESVEKAAKSLPTEITQAEIAKRKDFREVLTFTIDPVDAKDFDDALSLRKTAEGNWEVGVHIADVTHYLKPGTILDDEAVKRATSVYLVDRCVPMLPEVLSNFACSLRPHEEKYTFSAVFEMDKDANIVNEWYGKTVIYSDKRFAYEDVQTIIETGEGEYVNEIMVLDSLAKKMRAKRAANGSVFFDKEEVKFHLDEAGAPMGVYFKKQLDAHKLIEDFMLLANRKVAELLGKPKGNHKPSAPVVYRVHDTPSNEKMEVLSNFAGKFGYRMDVKSKGSITASINKLLKDVNGKKEASMIELLTVRSMPKAIYTTNNIGHYGLGFDYYTHFTSPIRRYPDVLVHRLLEAHLKGTTYSSLEELENLCKHSSDMEKLAAEAERSSIKFKQVEYMSQFVGETFRGMISGVTDFGIFVEIVENKCEGMVSMRDMKDDFYIYDEETFSYEGRNTGKRYALGDMVWIEVRKADVFKKRLDFIFAEDAREKDSGDRTEKRSQNKSSAVKKSVPHNDMDDYFADSLSNKKSAPKKYEGKFSETNAENKSGNKGGATTFGTIKYHGEEKKKDPDFNKSDRGQKKKPGPDKNKGKRRKR